MKTNKEKFVEIDGRIKLVNQRIDLIIKKELRRIILKSLPLVFRVFF